MFVWYSSQNYLQNEMEEEKIINITLDEPEMVMSFVKSLKEKGLNQERMVVPVSDFIKKSLKNAMNPAYKNAGNEVRDKILWVYNQGKEKSLSSVLENGYGVCLDFHALAAKIFSLLGIRYEFKVGSLPIGPKHTYLDIYIDGKWRIFDPFAEVCLSDEGKEAGLFTKEYYSESNTVS